MKSFFRVTTGIAFAAAMFASDIASAESFNQTKSGSFSFNAFDSTEQRISVIGSSGLIETFNPFNVALGTLQSVDVSWAFTQNFNVTVGPDNGGNISFVPGGTFFVGSSGYDGYGNNTSTGGGPGIVLSVSQPFSRNRSFVIAGNPDYDPAIQLAFTGNNTFDLQWATGAADLYANNISSGIMNFTHSASVTYNYTAAAVPEPETYALMLGGLGALGYVVRRRKSL